MLLAILLDKAGVKLKLFSGNSIGDTLFEAGDALVVDDLGRRQFHQLDALAGCPLDGAEKSTLPR